MSGKSIEEMNMRRLASNIPLEIKWPVVKTALHMAELNKIKKHTQSS